MKIKSTIVTRDNNQRCDNGTIDKSCPLNKSVYTTLAKWFNFQCHSKHKKVPMEITKPRLEFCIMLYILLIICAVRNSEQFKFIYPV